MAEEVVTIEALFERLVGVQPALRFKGRPFSLADANEALKVYYLPQVKKMLDNSPNLLKLLEQDDIEARGGKLEVPIKVR